MSDKLPAAPSDELLEKWFAVVGETRTHKFAKLACYCIGGFIHRTTSCAIHVDDLATNMSCTARTVRKYIAAAERDGLLTVRRDRKPWLFFPLLQRGGGRS